MSLELAQEFALGGTITLGIAISVGIATGVNAGEETIFAEHTNGKVAVVASPGTSAAGHAEVLLLNGRLVQVPVDTEIFHLYYLFP